MAKRPIKGSDKTLDEWLSLLSMEELLEFRRQSVEDKERENIKAADCEVRKRSDRQVLRFKRGF